MLRFQLWVDLVDADGDVLQEMSAGVFSDHLPRKGDTVVGIPDVLGPEEVTGWGGPGTVAFALPRKILETPYELEVLAVSHGIVFETGSQSASEYETATKVKVQLAFPGQDVMDEIRNLDSSPWVVYGGTEDDLL